MFYRNGWTDVLAKRFRFAYSALCYKTIQTQVCTFLWLEPCQARSLTLALIPVTYFPSLVDPEVILLLGPL